MDLSAETTAEIREPAHLYVFSTGKARLDMTMILGTSAAALMLTLTTAIGLGLSIALHGEAGTDPEEVARVTKMGALFFGLALTMDIIVARYVLKTLPTVRQCLAVKKAAKEKLRSSGFEIVGWISIAVRRTATLTPLYDPRTGKKLP